jgi:hypothetical protein
VTKQHTYRHFTESGKTVLSGTKGKLFHYGTHECVHLLTLVIVYKVATKKHPKYDVDAWNNNSSSFQNVDKQLSVWLIVLVMDVVVNKQE